MARKTEKAEVKSAPKTRGNARATREEKPERKAPREKDCRQAIRDGADPMQVFLDGGLTLDDFRVARLAQADALSRKAEARMCFATVKERREIKVFLRDLREAVMRPSFPLVAFPTTPKCLE